MAQTPRKKVVRRPPQGPKPGTGRPKGASTEQKVALDQARSMLRDKHLDIAMELIDQISAVRAIALGNGKTVDVPDYPTRQKAIEMITARSGFLPDPNDLPLTAGVLVLDVLARAKP